MCVCHHAYRRSNILTEPSAPTLAKWFGSRAKAMSNTSLSCAISCVRAWPVSTFQMVHVVSMLEVPIRFGSTSCQSNDVSGAPNSLFLFCAEKVPKVQKVRKKDER